MSDAKDDNEVKSTASLLWEGVQAMEETARTIEVALGTPVTPSRKQLCRKIADLEFQNENLNGLIAQLRDRTDWLYTKKLRQGLVEIIEEREILKSKASQFESTLKETMRVRDEEIAKLKRVIAKLTEQRNRAADRHHKQSLAKYRERIAQFEAEIAAIEREESGT